MSSAAQQSVANFWQPQRQRHGDSGERQRILFRAGLDDQGWRQLHRHHRAARAGFRFGRDLAVHRHAAAGEHRELRHKLKSARDTRCFSSRKKLRTTAASPRPPAMSGLMPGDTVLVSESPDGRGLSAAVTMPQGSVDNFGRVTADAGTIALEAKVVNQDGIFRRTRCKTKTASSNSSRPARSTSARIRRFSRKATVRRRQRGRRRDDQVGKNFSDIAAARFPSQAARMAATAAAWRSARKYRRHPFADGRLGASGFQRRENAA